MGTTQSRVVMSEVATEARPEEDQEGETRASIRLTPALIGQINGAEEAPTTSKPSTGGMTPQQQAAFKKQLQMAYAKGADECRKKMEAELKESSSSKTSLSQEAELAKKREKQESQRVEQLVSEINKKKYRAPLSDVQCSQERDACLKCYRNQNGNVLSCKAVADAFVHCARQNTEKFVGQS